MRHIAATQFKEGVIACLPTVFGYWSIGFAAGSVGSLSGYSIIEISMLAGLLYAGSAQFLFYGMAAAGAAPLAIAAAIFLVNVRYLLMSSALSPFFYGQTWLQKLLGGALLTDETFGVASQYSNKHDALPFWWLFGLNSMAYLNWIVANVLGATLAGSIPSSIADGLSFSLTAMFIGTLLLANFSSKNRVNDLFCIILSAAIYAALLGKVVPNIAVLLATVAGATAAVGVALFSRKREVSCRIP
ncbi:AzlC family ABC transporter permease [Methylobacterium tarhaniae]|uniref:AzlC family ABC transporter permease n=1 Tax=Methylobacterium tarhaniae TaxID=1187852 RepID=UPI0009F99C8D|nr:AzlC family ABC transporter permease [Methylobacterium tarhaniae]